jgi:hypothetical protein
VAVEEILDAETPHVRIRLDDTAPVRQTWERSTNYRGLFAPAPFSLLTKLQSSTNFYIEYTPYEKVPETIIFDSEDLGARTAVAFQARVSPRLCPNRRWQPFCRKRTKRVPLPPLPHLPQPLPS